jgi:copper chaperone CopZ
MVRRRGEGHVGPTQEAPMIETQLDVEGMTCGSCVRVVHQTLTALDGVDAVLVRQKEGQVTVRHAAEVATDALRRALDDAGYPTRVR